MKTITIKKTEALGKDAEKLELWDTAGESINW